ncbi:MAG: hypothetical protein L0338_26860 [Acidobacteria bacterium]|nr:hypothetical protein [Acidobacteriota bacterium]
MRINPLQGGAEAEGFGVGVGDEEPTPALRATPPNAWKGASGSSYAPILQRGFPGSHQTLMQNSGSTYNPRADQNHAGQTRPIQRFREKDHPEPYRS